MTPEERLAANVSMKLVLDKWREAPGRDLVALSQDLTTAAAKAIRAVRDKPKGTDCGDVA